MNCPECQHPKSEVLEKRGDARRRKCAQCGAIYRTNEYLDGVVPPRVLTERTQTHGSRPLNKARLTAERARTRISAAFVETVVSARRAIEDRAEARRLGLSIDDYDAEALGLC